MKAAVVHSFDQPLAIEDVAIPEPGPDQVLVRVETAGLCHTDIHAARGEWPVKPNPPFIPGHRVTIPWLGYACGDCAYCNSGRETLCEQQQNTGYSIDGGIHRVRRENHKMTLEHVTRAKCLLASYDANAMGLF